MAIKISKSEAVNLASLNPIELHLFFFAFICSNDLERLLPADELIEKSSFSNKTVKKAIKRFVQLQLFELEEGYIVRNKLYIEDKAEFLIPLHLFVDMWAKLSIKELHLFVNLLFTSKYGVIKFDAERRKDFAKEYGIGIPYFDRKRLINMESELVRKGFLNRMDSNNKKHSVYQFTERTLHRRD